MTGTTTQSIFQSTYHKPTWQSYAVSMVVHSVLAFLALTIVIVPAVREARRQMSKIILAPLPDYKPRVQPPPKIVAPKIVLERQPVVPQPKVFVPPPLVRHEVEEHKIVAVAPEIKETVPQPIPDLKTPTPPAPKPQVKVGTFQQTSELAKAAPAPQKAAVGGFGDPNGVPASDASRKGPVTMARVGAFDLPNGSGKGGAGGQALDGGAFKQTGFGSGGPTGHAQPGTQAGAMRSAGFGDATKVPVAANGPRTDGMGSGAATPVQILYKPKPVYSSEARSMRLEGEVTLQVVFQANGTVRVVKILRSLGHGLDEAAQEAAMRVKFKPATRGGTPVDTDATINITFELT